MSTVLLVILVLLLIGALPNWGYSRGWGYYPSGGIGIILLILLILVLTGRPDDAWLASWSRAEAAVPHPLDPIVLGRTALSLLRAPAH